MRTSTLTIQGDRNTPCCFSTRVLLALEERGKREKPVKSATEMLSSIMENEALSDAFWLLHQLMVAGNRYAKLEGLDAPEVFSLDDMIDPGGRGGLSRHVRGHRQGRDGRSGTVRRGGVPKNADTTQADLSD